MKRTRTASTESDSYVGINITLPPDEKNTREKRYGIWADLLILSIGNLVIDAWTDGLNHERSRMMRTSIVAYKWGGGTKLTRERGGNDRIRRACNTIRPNTRPILDGHCIQVPTRRSLSYGEVCIPIFFV